MTTTVSLGPRLQMVASFVPEGSRLGDIGTDHAYLPIALYETGRIIKAVAVDVHEGPYISALTAVKNRHFQGVIDVRLGDGLMPLLPGEVNVLTLAGMGGRTMLDILSARPDVLETVSSLILQPQGAEGAVRLALPEGNWMLKAERLVEEDDRKYVVMAFSKEEGWSKAKLLEKEAVWFQRLRPLCEKNSFPEKEYAALLHKLVWHIGLLILDERPELLGGYLNEYSAMLLRRLEQMKKSNKSGIITKIQEVSMELALVEGLEKWQ